MDGLSLPDRFPNVRRFSMGFLASYRPATAQRGTHRWSCHAVGSRSDHCILVAVRMHILHAFASDIIVNPHMHSKSSHSSGDAQLVSLGAGTLRALEQFQARIQSTEMLSRLWCTPGIEKGVILPAFINCVPQLTVFPALRF